MNDSGALASWRVLVFSTSFVVSTFVCHRRRLHNHNSQVHIRMSQYEALIPPSSRVRRQDILQEEEAAGACGFARQGLGSPDFCCMCRNIHVPLWGHKPVHQVRSRFKLVCASSVSVISLTSPHVYLVHSANDTEQLSHMS